MKIKNYSVEISLILIQILLLILRFEKIINWKWVYVLMPLWILLTIIVLLLVFAIYVDKYFEKNYDR